MSSSRRKRPKFGSVGDSSPSFPILREPPSNIFPSRDEFLRLLAVIAIAASVAFACNRVVLFFNRQPKPFCDTGEHLVSDLCKPCPDNGHCSDGQLMCLHGYKKLGRKCIEDGEINQAAKKLSDWVEDYMCNAYGQALCDEAGKIWFEEADVMKLIDEHGSRINILSKDEAVVLVRQKVLGNLENSLENRANISGKEYRCPDVLAKLYKPLLCRVRQWLYAHVVLMMTCSSLFLGFMKFLWNLRQKRKVSARAEQLYEQACEILEDSAMMAKSMNNGCDPWVVASWLRDHLLLPRERKDVKLWKKVEELLLEDSRIDQYPKLVKGESKIVLEWQATGSLSSKVRAKRSISKMKPGDQVSVHSSYQQREAAVSESSVS